MADKKEEKPEEKAEEKEEKKEGEAAEGAAEGEGGDGGAAPSGSKKKLIILIALVVLLVGGGVGAYFAGVFPGAGTSTETEHDETLIPKIIYYDLQEFLVNLNEPGKKTSFLKMTITLELPNERAKALVEAQLPRIRDSFQVYLRELRSSDLQGSAGLVRLREELLLRINKILETERVKDILFKEILVQ